MEDDIKQLQKTKNANYIKFYSKCLLYKKRKQWKKLKRFSIKIKKRINRNIDNLELKKIFAEFEYIAIINSQVPVNLHE